jgi:hypothetical protein
MDLHVLYVPPKPEGIKLPRREIPFPAGGTLPIEDTDTSKREVLKFVAPQVIPMLFTLTCLQCDAHSTGLLYLGPQGPSLAILSGTLGGLTTPRTPAGVGYYLDQAYRAHGIGAYSAAVAMYRAALEQLLYEQGYQSGMLAAKIKKLEEDTSAGNAPKWARELDTEYLTVLKKLGNGAIHANGGNVAKQGVLDAELIARIEATMSGLLFEAYEISHVKKQQLHELKNAARVLKK